MTPRTLAAVLLVHALTAATWVGAFGLGVGEATPAGQSSDQRFYVGAVVGGAFWLAAGVWIVMRWRSHKTMWWVPLAWWIPALVIAFIAALSN